MYCEYPSVLQIDGAIYLFVSTTTGSGQDAAFVQRSHNFSDAGVYLFYLPSCLSGVAQLRRYLYSQLNICSPFTHSRYFLKMIANHILIGPICILMVGAKMQGQYLKETPIAIWYGYHVTPPTKGPLWKSMSFAWLIILSKMLHS